MIENTNDPVNGTSSVTRYQHPNHQGSTTLETNESGNVITYEEYHPFGTTSYQATNVSVMAAAKRYRYTGMERDDETGLEYHNARYYISWLGRWMNCDPIGIGDGVNVYAYCRNNPVGNVDESGTQTQLQTTEVKTDDDNIIERKMDNYTFKFNVNKPQEVTIEKLIKTEGQEDKTETIVLNFAILKNGSLSLFNPHTSQQIASEEGFVNSMFMKNSGVENSKQVFNGDPSRSLEELNKAFVSGERAVSILTKFLNTSKEVKLEVVGNWQFSRATENYFTRTNSGPKYGEPKDIKEKDRKLFAQDRADFIAKTFFSVNGKVAENVTAKGRYKYGDEDNVVEPVKGVKLAPVSKDAYGATIFFNFAFKKINLPKY